MLNISILSLHYNFKRTLKNNTIMSSIIRKQVRQDILDLIKKDDELLIQIAKHANVRWLTAYSWTKQSHPNHIMLTAEAIQSIIKTGLGLSEDSVITEDVQSVTKTMAA